MPCPNDTNIHCWIVLLFTVYCLLPTAYCSVWCERGDSNPHTFRYQILSLARLPIPPLSQARRTKKEYHAGLHSSQRAVSG